MDALTGKPLPPKRPRQRMVFGGLLIALLALLSVSLIVWHFTGQDDKEPQWVYIHVSTGYPGADARTVADVVAVPIERQVKGAAGVAFLSSWSENHGNYDLWIAFQPGTDPLLAEKVVRDRVARVKPLLPEDVRDFGCFPSNFRGDSTGLTAVLVGEDGFAGPREAVRQLEKALKAGTAPVVVGTNNDSRDGPRLIAEPNREACDRLKVRLDEVNDSLRIFHSLGPYRGDRREVVEYLDRHVVRDVNGNEHSQAAVVALRQTTQPHALRRHDLLPAATLQVIPYEGTSRRAARAAVQRIFDKSAPAGVQLLWLNTI